MNIIPPPPLSWTVGQLVPPPPKKNLHIHCFQFLLGITVVPREIEYNGYAQFRGINKVLYGLCESEQVDGLRCFKSRSVTNRTKKILKTMMA